MQGAANERVIQYVFMIKLNSRKLQTKIKRSSENGNEQMRLFVLQKALPRLIRDFKTQVKMKRYCSVSGINICYNFLQNRTTIAPPPPIRPLRSNIKTPKFLAYLMLILHVKKMKSALLSNLTTAFLLKKIFTGNS